MIENTIKHSMISSVMLRIDGSAPSSVSTSFLTVRVALTSRKIRTTPGPPTSTSGHIFHTGSQRITPTPGLLKPIAPLHIYSIFVFVAQAGTATTSRLCCPVHSAQPRTHARTHTMMGMSFTKEALDDEELAAKDVEDCGPNHKQQIEHIPRVLHVPRQAVCHELGKHLAHSAQCAMQTCVCTCRLV